MRDHSIEGLMSDLRRLIAAVDAHDVELPEVGQYRTDLELAMAELKASEVRKADLKRRRMQATREALEQRSECRELAMRLRSLILAHFGPRDERLPAFGIKIGGKRARGTGEPEKKKGSLGFH